MSYIDARNLEVKKDYEDMRGNTRYFKGSATQSVRL